MFTNILRGCTLLAIVAISACGGAISSPDQSINSNPTKTPFPPPPPVGLETPAASAIYLGAYAATTPVTPNIATLQQTIGRNVAMDMHYYGWTGNFPLTAEAGDIVSGTLPIESWNCQLTDAQVAAGAGDLLITTRALAIKSFGHPVFIRYFSEMNEPAVILNHSTCYDPSTDNPDTTFSAAQYVAAWQHIRQIFAQEQVTNAIWVWSFGAGADPTPYYPGDAYVDWVGFDAYDPTGVGFAPTIAPLYAVAATFHKPILIAEAGSSGVGIAAGVNQTTFFTGAAADLKTMFPLVRGFVYFDSTAAPMALIPATNWQIRPTGIDAFRTFATDPYLSAFASL